MSTVAENNKRIAKNTLALYIRMLLVMVVSLYTSRVILHVLGVEDFGIYNLVAGVVVLFSFLNNAMTSASQRYLNVAIGQNDKNEIQRVFSSSLIMHISLIVIVLFGATRSSAAAWNIADIGIGIMCWINFIALLILSSIAIKILKDYERQKHLGLDPVFEPDDCGIKNATLWNEIVKEKYADLLEKKHSAEK